MEPTADGDSLGFGPFVVDVRRRELRKHGRRIRLSGQPFEVLVALLDARGETVTRESLRDRLWPGVPFGDFDNRLTVAVKKLRDHLGDSADTPRYISTVDRQGYRFAATVTIVPSSKGGERHSAADTPPVPVVPPTPSAVVVPTARRIAWGRLGILGLFATLIAAVLMASGLIAWMSSREQAPAVERVAQLTHSGGVHPTQQLLTDGPRLYFLERTGGIIESKWLLPAGGPSVRLALPFESFDLQDISPDGSDLIVRDLTGFPRGEATLWLAPVGGGPPRRIGKVSAGSAKFTSDGRAVLFARDSEVFVCDRDGNHLRRLLTVSGTVDTLDVSPVGDRMTLAIIDGVPPRTRLWEAETDGTGLRPLVDEGEIRPGVGGGWSADGRWFTFSARDSSGQNIWLLDHRSHTLQRLTSGPLEYRRPIFSHDGRRIFCVGVNRRVELLRYQLATRQFVPMLGGASAEHVRYSPRGLEIAYVTYPEGVLWRARPDGGDRFQLTPTSLRALDPHWSPDGSRILFEAQTAPGGPWGVYVVAASGGSPERVWETNWRGFAWSRDGRSIILARAEQSTPLTHLNLDDRTTSDLSRTEGLWYPVRSPSGRYLLATDVQAWTLQVLDLESHTKRSLGRAGQYASWSSNEQFVYFNRFENSKPAMYRVRLADGDLTELFTLDEFNPGGSWGAWSGVTPDGDVLLTRDLGGTDLYSINLSERTVAQSRFLPANAFP